MWARIRSNINLLLYISLLVIGVFLRLYRISTESISLEEYACIANLNAEGLFKFISLQRHTYPFGGILFPLLQFLWVRFAENNIVSLRVLSILFWVATYILIVGFVHREERKSTLPEGVSVFVAVGLCFSPALIFLGQEARMYMAYVFFAWCSIISLYYLLQKPESYLRCFLWCISNACLLWTHHAGIVLWCVEGLIVGVLFIRKFEVRKYLLLGGVFHFVLVLLWLVWILTIPPQPPELYQYYLPPTIRNLVEFPLAFNIVRYGGICPADAYLSFYYLPQPIGEIVRCSHKALNTLLLIISGFSILGFVAWTAQSIQNGYKLPLYLLILFTLPPIFLFLIARLGPPVFTSRYLVFLLPFHFCGLGMLISPARKIFRLEFTLIVCLLLFYQIGYMVSAKWRTDWKGVGEVISARAGVNDLIIVWDPFWTKLFEINCPNVGIPVSDVYTYGGIVEIAKVYLSSLRRDKINASIWVVAPDVHGKGVPTLMSHIENQYFSASVRMLPGELRIWLYKLDLTASPPTRFYTALLPAFTKSLPYLLEEETIEKVRNYYKQHRFDHDRTGFHLVRTGLVLAMNRKFSVAKDLITEAWNKNPNRIVEDCKFFSELVSEDFFENNVSLALFREGLKCYLEKDFTLAVDSFLQISFENPEDPLPYWFLAKAYDNLSNTTQADFFWRGVFNLEPILPIGWHLSYEPAVITLDRDALTLARQREDRLGIVTDELFE